jgi:hypothetical protein
MEFPRYIFTSVYLRGQTFSIARKDPLNAWSNAYLSMIFCYAPIAIAGVRILTQDARLETATFVALITSISIALALADVGLGRGAKKIIEDVGASHNLSGESWVLAFVAALASMFVGALVTQVDDRFVATLLCIAFYVAGEALVAASRILHDKVRSNKDK